MAGIYYRSQQSGNWSATSTWYQYNSPTGWVVATDYPKTGDYVWIQGAHVVTYDATAITANNGATFAQISNRIDANGSAVAQPTPSTGGVGAINASSGYIALSVASPTTIASTYYSVLSSTNSLFTITASSTFTFEGTFQKGTTGGFIKADTGSAGSTLNFTGNPVGGTGASGQCIFLGTSITTNISGTSVKGGDGATSYGIYISSGTQTINITSTDVSGSDVSSTGYAIASANTNAHTITIIGNVNSGQTCGAINCASSTILANTGASVTVNGNVRNYGLSGSTPTEYFVAIQARQVKIKQAASLAFNTTDGGAKDYTTAGATTVTEASIWAYLASAATTSGSLGKLIVDNLNATVGSRATQTSVDTLAGYVDTEVAAIKAKTDNLPNNPSSNESVTAIVTAAVTAIP